MTQAWPADEARAYQPEGFRLTIPFRDKRIKACLERRHPFSSSTENLRDVISRNLLIIFRILVFYNSFADLDDYWVAAAEDLGPPFSRYTLKRIVSCYRAARKAYHIEVSRWGIPTVDDHIGRMLCLLADQYATGRVRVYRQTERRSAYNSDLRACWREKARENVLSLLEEFPDPPPLPQGCDWLHGGLVLRERSRSPSPEIVDTPPHRSDNSGSRHQSQRQHHQYRSRSPIGETRTLALRPRIPRFPPADSTRKETQARAPATPRGKYSDVAADHVSVQDMETYRHTLANSKSDGHAAIHELLSKASSEVEKMMRAKGMGREETMEILDGLECLQSSIMAFERAGKIAQQEEAAR